MTHLPAACKKKEIFIAQARENEIGSSKRSAGLQSCLLTYKQPVYESGE